MLNLLDKKSWTWESLTQSGREWAQQCVEARELSEELEGREMTPQEVFDEIFDKDQQREMIDQE